MGIRMATDLNLHRRPRFGTPKPAPTDREARNRERTWIMCFVLDRSFSSQLGKPHCILEDGTILQNLTRWHHHPLAISTDAGLTAYAELQRVLSRSLDFLYAGYSAPSDLQTDCDYLLVVKTIEAQFMTWKLEWSEVEKTLPGYSSYRSAIARFYLNYAMLVINSFGLQSSLERSGSDMGHFFGRVHSSASTVVMIMRDELAPAGYLKYSPDSHFVQASYAVLSLLKASTFSFPAITF